MTDNGPPSANVPENTASVLSLIDPPLRVVGLIVIVALSILTITFYGTDQHNSAREWYPLAVLALFLVIAVMVLCRPRIKETTLPNQTSTVQQGGRGGAFSNVSGN